MPEKILKKEMSVPITLRITEKTHKRLVQRSRKLNLALSSYLRYCIERLNDKGDMPKDLSE